jgi:nicotinamide-nucleotide amidase
MIAEVLATGHEIISGNLVDSNSAHIARALEAAGLEVVRHTSVGDDMGRLVDVIKEVGGRADIAVVTGGLGPTFDDITAAAAARAAGVELVMNNTALKSVEEAFKTRKRFMSPSNKKQALLPNGSECLLNPVGTAPGFHQKIGQCLFFFLPGVPFEMERMLADMVMPRIEAVTGSDRDIRILKTISVFGLAESAVGEQVGGLTTEFPKIKLGIRAKFPEIQIKLYGHGSNEDVLLHEMEKASKWILNKVGTRAFAMDNRSMEAVIGDLLRQNQATLAVAESCTAGLISHLLTNVPGSSGYFLFAGVTYSNDSKERILGVSSHTLEQYGAVHEQTVKEMSAGVRRLANATYGLATSGIAGPDGGTDDKPIGTVCVGLATEHSLESHQFYFPFGNRLMKKKIFAMAAMDVLRRKILNLD